MRSLILSLLFFVSLAAVSEVAAQQPGGLYGDDPFYERAVIMAHIYGLATPEQMRQMQLDIWITTPPAVEPEGPLFPRRIRRATTQPKSKDGIAAR